MGEPGCLRFDFLRDEKESNKFTMYEVYRDAAAIGAHKEMPYVKEWGKLQYSQPSPLVSKTIHRCVGVKKPIVLVAQFEVVPERVAEFMDVMTKSMDGSRKEPGCLQFDILRDEKESNKFTMYEVYRD